MLFPRATAILYQYFLKPILFCFDPEWVHNLFTRVGESLESQPKLVSSLFAYKSPTLHKTVLGVDFSNPIGLAAGFDYDGHMAQVMSSVGFGFNTVGTVTACAYSGNPGPRLARLPKSRSLLVNKGFKSEGARAVRARLDRKNLSRSTVGISVGSSNIPKIDTINKAIDDYLTTLRLFRSRPYVKYFELNISCPNIRLKDTFTSSASFTKLCSAVANLKLTQPIFVKMPNEISPKDSDQLVAIALKHNIHGFIFSNLVKDRSNPAFNQAELTRVSHMAGNFSGRPAYNNSNMLIAHTRQQFGNQVAIIGCGGVFNARDAQAKLDAGADLVQLITGVIFQGPQLIGQINKTLSW